MSNLSPKRKASISRKPTMSKKRRISEFVIKTDIPVEYDTSSQHQGGIQAQLLSAITSMQKELRELQVTTARHEAELQDIKVKRIPSLTVELIFCLLRPSWPDLCCTRARKPPADGIAFASCLPLLAADSVQRVTLCIGNTQPRQAVRTNRGNLRACPYTVPLAICASL
jgi:hypothetical protein